MITIRPVLVVKVYRQPWRLANERAAILAARSRTSVPAMLWSHTRPAAHAAFRYLSGPTLVGASGGDQLVEVLDYLDQAHAIPGDRFGRVTGPWFDTWADFLRDRIDHYRAVLLAQGQNAPAAVAAALAGLPPPPLSTPRLIHNDPTPGNFIRSHGNLVGIDWELTAFGDPALDAARAAWEWGVEHEDLGALARKRGVDLDRLRYYQALHALGRLMNATTPSNPDVNVAQRCLATLTASPWADPITTWTPDT